MKRTLMRSACIIMVACAAFVTAFADSSITQQDIDAGLTFCKEYPVKLVLDENEITMPVADVPPVIVKERTLIPARALFENMGGTVIWENETQSVHVILGETTVVLTIGSSVAWVNGEAKTLEVPAMIIDHDGDYFGSTMIPVRFTAEALGCHVSWRDPDRAVVIESPQSDVQNPEPEIPEIPVTSAGGVTSHTAISFWDNFAYEPIEPLNPVAADKLIAIDLGHGGKDTGAIGHEDLPDELYEKKVNLAVGLYLRDLLREAGANVFMIREKDVYYTLLERAAFANDSGAQLFVSIHNNSSDYGWPEGTEVHYYSKIDAEGRDEKQLYGIYSKDVAQAVQTEMVAALGTLDREIKSSPKLAVLNKTSMPAIIVEGAFISNEGNFAMMKSEDYAKRYAYAVAKGLVTVLNDTFQE